jgi:hypothetical protein
MVHKGLSEDSHGLFEGRYRLVMASRNSGKPSVSTRGNSAEIRTMHVPNIVIATPAYEGKETNEQHR